MSDLSKMINEKDIIITEYGFISNLMHQTLDRERTFYLLDQNFDPIALGLGISIVRSEKTFIIISEDTFQSLITSIINLLENNTKNLIILVFNFKKYDEFLLKQVFSSMMSTELSKIAKAIGLKSYNITKNKEFRAVLKKIYHNSETILIELMMNKVDIKESLHQLEFMDLKNNFMNALK
ncbi:MAG: hypothetical protein EAX96_05770 [Candidatus Lokiarchaeota archaeon]|nr:hypothetical protein [Candidatus Lokiarchaeota archaeon]